MGRMLEALKNLEARSAWPQAKQNVLASLVAEPLQPRARTASPAPAASVAPPDFTIAVLPPAPAAVVAEMPLGASAVYAPVIVSSPLLDEPKFITSPVSPELPSAAVARAPDALQTPTAQPAAPPGENCPPAASLAARTPTSRRPPRGAELAVRRALAEPHRREPIAELASRVRQDSQETGSRTILLVGVGAESITHEALLHLAALLAEEGGQVLLVDGDSARRSLSLDLDALQQPGLTDLLTHHEPADTLLQPTAFEGLSFLPAGGLVHSALPGDPLARRLGQLASGFDLLLIDGGRCGDPAVPALARLVDATYILVQLGAVEASAAQAALRDLRASGARVLGCIAAE